MGIQQGKKKKYICLQSISTYALGGSIAYRLPPVYIINSNSSRNLPQCPQHTFKKEGFLSEPGMYVLVGVSCTFFFFFFFWLKLNAVYAEMVKEVLEVIARANCLLPPSEIR